MLRHWSRWERRAAPYLFISPFFIVFAVFFLGPLLFAIYTSFTEWRGIGAPVFIGLDNYVEFMTSDDVRRVLGNTLWYAAGMLLIMIPLAFTLALLLNVRWNRAKEPLRLIYFLPSITSAIVIGLIWSMLYDVRYGLLNWLLSLVGVEPIAWLTSRTWFKPSALMMMVWRWVGYNAVYFLAGLQNISPELLEAAEIDGANWFQRLFRITIPLLRPVILLVLLLEFISSFQLFEDIYILGEDQGGPAGAGLTTAMYLYRSGFVFGQMGYASAVGVMYAIMIFVVSLVQMRVLGVFED